MQPSQSSTPAQPPASIEGKKAKAIGAVVAASAEAGGDVPSGSAAGAGEAKWVLLVPVNPKLAMMLEQEQMLVLLVNKQCWHKKKCVRAPFMTAPTSLACMRTCASQ